MLQSELLKCRLLSAATLERHIYKKIPICPEESYMFQQAIIKFSMFPMVFAPQRLHCTAVYLGKLLTYVKTRP